MCKIGAKQSSPLWIRALVVLAITSGMFCAQNVRAQASPPGCNGAAPILNLNVSPSVTTNGGVTTWQIRYQNDPGNAANACDLDNATITFACPGPGGGPGPQITLVSGLSVPAGTSLTFLTNVTCIINVGDSNGATGQAHSVGTLLSDPTVFPSEDNRPVAVVVRHPKLCITKQCVNGTCEDGVIQFNGTVLNCGDTGFTNVTVVDVVDGVSTTVGTFPGTLAPGGSFTYSSSYVATHTPSTNFVTVTGNALTVGGVYSATTNAVCTLSGSPLINVTKECQQTVAGGTITFNGTVSNPGLISIYDVTVTDDHAGQVLSLAVLAPSASSNYSGSYLPTTCPSTNVVTASAHSSPLCGNQPVSAVATAFCGSGAAGIAVTKNCRLTGDCDSPTVDFDGHVTNNGSVPLINVAVTDSITGPLTLSATTLAPGGTATFSGSYVMTDNPSTNTVVATGTGDAAGITCGGSNVSAQANCIVPIAGAPCINVTKVCDFGDSAQTNVVFSGTVSNCGDMTLTDVTVSDNHAGVVLTLASLAPGASSNYSGSYGPIACPGTFSDVVTAIGHDRTICALPFGGDRVVTDTAPCSVTCEVPGCRTTGGGKQPKDDTCPEVRYVTHGGQVGAPFGQSGSPSCATDSGFNNPCIRGEYQHVRHIKGGLRGTFHAASNGHVHQFDSLMCACLPCDDFTTSNPFGGCHPDDRHYNSANATQDGLCNPDDHKVCGPLPRPAPANKIAFSGVGNYTLSNGKKAPQSVVFRVDLEDRSEPGGAHPRGGQAPPDRYRMRMWFIPAGQTADSPAIKALREAVSVKDPLDERVMTTLPCVGGAVPAPDIDDGGDLDRGNRQIHPNTGASCKD